jgi:hypothetical protein
MVMASLFLHQCSSGLDQRLLAVGGIHTFEMQTPCKLTRVEPEGALKDLEWVDTLTVEAKSEGTGEVICGDERMKVRAVAPVRLQIKLVSEGQPIQLKVHERFKVEALLYDHEGKELEVGKFTIFDWMCSEILEVANDRSAGEFGFCDTCFGMHTFRAIRSGKGSISARLGSLQGALTVVANLR